jgi:type IV pilus assembly protein PilV
MDKALRRQQGVMLLEALIGILIFSLGILTMIALQATAMRATIDSKFRSEASFLANEIIGSIWVDRATLSDWATSPGTPASCGSAKPCGWITKVKATLPMDATTPANTEPEIAISSSQVTVTIRWKREGDADVSRHTVVAQINGS